MNFINLTPHEINIFKNGSLAMSVPPSGSIARVSCSFQKVGEAEGVEFFSTSYGSIEGLPEEKPDTIYIVSGMVLEAALKYDPLRSGIASPGELIRNEKGQPIGCNGLRIK